MQRVGRRYNPKVCLRTAHINKILPWGIISHLTVRPTNREVPGTRDRRRPCHHMEEGSKHPTMLHSSRAPATLLNRHMERPRTAVDTTSIDKIG